MPEVNPLLRQYLGAKRLREGISNFKKGWQIVALLAGLSLIPGLTQDGVETWVIAVIVLVLLAAAISNYVYRKRTNDLHALIFFMEIMYASMAAVLFLLTFNFAKVASTYVYLNKYFYVPILIAMISFLYGIFWGLKYWPDNIKSSLGFVKNSTIGSGELYSTFFSLPSLREWNKGNMKVYFGIVSFLSLFAALTFGGHDYLFLVAFLMLCAAMPSSIASILVRRIYFQKYYRNNPVQINDLDVRT